VLRTSSTVPSVLTATRSLYPAQHGLPWCGLNQHTVVCPNLAKSLPVQRRALNQHTVVCPNLAKSPPVQRRGRCQPSTGEETGQTSDIASNNRADSFYPFSPSLEKLPSALEESIVSR